MYRSRVSEFHRTFDVPSGVCKNTGRRRMPGWPECSNQASGFTGMELFVDHGGAL
ncbi:MAG TPA: hypothetical protein VF708_08815 [Pyrinomonadaceae bacterium]